MLPILNITHEQFRTLVLEFLKRQEEVGYSSQFANLPTHLGTLAVVLGFIEAPQPNWEIRQNLYGRREEYLNPADVNRATNVIWDLIVEGIVRPGTGDSGQCDLPFFHVTEYGRQKIKDATTPYDPDGYLNPSVTVSVGNHYRPCV